MLTPIPRPVSYRSQRIANDIDKDAPTQHYPDESCKGEPTITDSFAIYVNGLPQVCKGEVHRPHFADDFIIWRQEDKDGFLSTDLQHTQSVQFGTNNNNLGGFT